MTQKHAKWSAGAAEVVITPPVGTPLLGTIQRSTGVHDELFARALVLNDGKQRVAIVSLDLIGFDLEFSDRIRDAIRARTGISLVLIHGTHNHCAPFTVSWSVLGTRWFAGPGRNWRDSLTPALVDLVSRAEANSEAAVLRAGRSPVHIGTNRRFHTGQGIVMKPNPDGPVVPWVDVLRVDRPDGSPSAILFSHAAHPVIIHGSSRLISADFPGFASHKLKERFGGNVIALFGQAFDGNINADPLRGGIVAAEQAGGVLAEAAFQAAVNSKPIPPEEFSLASAHTELPFQPLPAHQDCARALKEAEDRLAKHHGRTAYTDEQLWDMQDEVASIPSQLESKAVDDTQPMEDKAWWMTDTVLCLRDMLHQIETRAERTLRFDAHRLRIGNHWSLLAVTHELFAEYQLMLDKDSPTEHTMMLGHTNGDESYIPLDRDLALGGYEAASFPDLNGASLRFPQRRALRLGFERQVTETLRSLWN